MIPYIDVRKSSLLTTSSTVLYMIVWPADDKEQLFNMSLLYWALHPTNVSHGISLSLPSIPLAPREKLTTKTVKLITSFLLSYPLAAVLKRIPDGRPALKNLFIIRQVHIETKPLLSIYLNYFAAFQSSTSSDYLTCGLAREPLPLAQLGRIASHNMSRVHLCHGLVLFLPWATCQ